MQNIQKKIQKLCYLLRHWQHLYYSKSISEVSDEKYDLIMEKLIELEKKYPRFRRKNSPSQGIYLKKSKNFSYIKNRKKILSLRHISKECDLFKFDKRIKKNLNYKKIVTYCCELKIDGLVVNLQYKNGVLKKASTRGDGYFGEDVTENIRTIKTIPWCLNSEKGMFPSQLDLQGEVFISKKNFLRLNDNAKKKKQRLFSNSRNAASGSLRHSNPRITRQRALSFFCFGYGYVKKNVLPKSHWECLRQFERWGIPVCSEKRQCSTLEEILFFYKRIQKKRYFLKFDIDGIVVKVDNIQMQKKLGNDFRSPRWAVAYKFFSKNAITKIKKINFRIGRTGIITPVARIHTVNISGTKISNINLHNFCQIEKLNLMINDTVVVRRAGDVIPQIVRVVYSKRTENAIKIIYPKRCTDCKSFLKRKKNSGVLYCPSYLTCPAQIERCLRHFVSKKAMNIQGIGKKTVSQLMRLNLVRDPSDFFRLTLRDLRKLKRMQSKSIRNLSYSLERSKKTTLFRVIYALGIPKTGEITAARLTSVFTNIDALMSANILFLKRIANIGKSTAESIYNFFHDSKNKKVLRSLFKNVVIVP